jgi:hypothetical protein
MPVVIHIPEMEFIYLNLTIVIHYGVQKPFIIVCIIRNELKRIYTLSFLCLSSFVIFLYKKTEYIFVVLFCEFYVLYIFFFGLFFFFRYLLVLNEKKIGMNGLEIKYCFFCAFYSFLDMNKCERIGAEELLSLLSDEELMSVKDTVTKSMITTDSVSILKKNKNFISFIFF